MPEKSGIEVVAELDSEKVPVIVFVTAYDHFAVQAFECHALDYVLKPFSNQRLLAALERASRQGSPTPVMEANAE